MKSLEELKKIREKAQQDLALRNKDARIKIVVGMGTSGIAAGARDVLKTLVDEISNNNITDAIVTQTGEKGFSSAEPIVEIQEQGKETIIYGNVTPAIAKQIVKEHIKEGKVLAQYIISK
ncbi:MAG: (2Fe-2S) ferredoxin domain-containing protein [Spirochaetes bacterium]|jgi:NADP-reducing hydrogenase subunit HndB|nr:(2Fe-2S) ferredoxin domain-containing protein [Spirochaetota bacterium]NLJ04083.1 (2Fe-2S) ferredoxin domain-containing protein [Exilispira sp.]MBP8990739.1 (2Fe-2S) ferredoxin domain-containing protein [Spirochaetota bacterium]HNV43264.1 (2Fe-2S) ferredoxin domain-containing protein [Exilispira sp.]HOV45699.1 (2Fe-2S) ferredoxin domain-containing protein [Exilispira sp.]